MKALTLYIAFLAVCLFMINSMVGYSIWWVIKDQCDTRGYVKGAWFIYDKDGVCDRYKREYL